MLTHLKSETSDQAITGWRVWRIVDGRLLSMNFDTHWPTNQALRADALFQTTTLNKVSEILMAAVAVSVSAALLAILFSTLLDLLHPDLDALVRRIIILSVMGVNSIIIGATAAALLHWKSNQKISPVAPRSMTPGIYAIHDPGELETPLILTRTGLLVMGRVYLWGDTIEHEYGVKGEFAYPLSIEQVACATCTQWMPLEQYADHDLMPRHDDCLPAQELNTEPWRNHRLDDLMEQAPWWFDGNQIKPQVPHPASQA